MKLSGIGGSLPGFYFDHSSDRFVPELTGKAGILAGVILTQADYAGVIIVFTCRELKKIVRDSFRNISLNEIVPVGKIIRRIGETKINFPQP